jgi:hypothetical protein
MWEGCYCGFVGTESSKSPLQPNNFVNLWPGATFPQPYTPFFPSMIITWSTSFNLATIDYRPVPSFPEFCIETQAIDAGLTLALIGMQADVDAIVEILGTTRLARLWITWHAWAEGC